MLPHSPLISISSTVVYVSARLHLTCITLLGSASWITRNPLICSLLEEARVSGLSDRLQVEGTTSSLIRLINVSEIKHNDGGTVFRVINILTNYSITDIMFIKIWTKGLIHWRYVQNINICEKREYTAWVKTIWEILKYEG